MSDVIDRQQAIDAIMGEPPELHYPSWYAELIKRLPVSCPEDEVDEGEWVMVYHNNRHTIGHIECNRCGFKTEKHRTYKYCPGCGKKMSNHGEI